MKFLTKYIEQFSGLPRQCWLNIMLCLVESSIMGVIYFLPIFFIHMRHFSMTQSGGLISLYGIGAIIGGFSFGKLNNNNNSKQLLFICLSVQTICFLGLSLSQLFWQYAVLILFIGIASYGFITSNQVHLLKICPAALRLKGINLLSTASNLGLAFSAIVISLLNYRDFIRVFSISSLIFLGIALLVVRLPKTNQTVMSEQVTASSSLSAQKRRQIIITILCCVFMIGTIVAQLGASYALYIENNINSQGLHALGLLFALNSMMVVLLETPLGNFYQNSNKLRMIGIASCLIGSGMFLLIFSRRIEVAILACIIYTLGEIIFFCMTQYVCFQLSPSNQKGMGLGLFRSVYAASRIAGPIAGGYIYHYGSGELLWICCGIIGLICLIACMKQSQPALI